VRRTVSGKRGLKSLVHEMNNSLNGVLGLSQVLSIDLPEDSTWYVDVQKITRCAQKCKSIAKKLLVFSKQP